MYLYLEAINVLLKWWPQTENTASGSETAQELKEDDNIKTKLLFHKFTISSTYISYSWS